MYAMLSGTLIIDRVERTALKVITRFFAVCTTLLFRVLAEILFSGIIVHLRLSSPFSKIFFPVT